MKFLTKINRNYLILFSSVLLLLSFSGYFILKTMLKENAKENLLVKATLVEKQIAETGELPNLNPLVEVTEVTDQPDGHAKFSDEILFNKEENEQEAYIEYSTVIQINNKYYSIKLREASVESEDLAASIAVSLFILLLAAFAIAYVITQKLNKTIWTVFEKNLKAIEQFNFQENLKLQLNSSGIEEFDRLNLVVNNLTDKLNRDFQSLKEFTENASHEIQTPLAIASMNLEEILQQELNEESFTKVITAINSLKRLSALNQNLLLLAKIENNQFKAGEFIEFNELFERKIQEFEPLYKAKNVQIHFSSESEFRIKMNTHLAGIMMNNLLSNAINHNVTNGSISISVSERQISICNTGGSNELTDDKIFNRFAKGNSKSHGLGLAIVKQICQTHQLDIHYTKNESHCFTINHKTEKH